MNSAFYAGTIAHKRYLPKEHNFHYPFFMYFLCLDELEQQPDIGLLFSVKKWAISRFYRPDYFGQADIPLHLEIKKRMEELTGKKVLGKVYGLLNLRTMGLYFSPVNFYYGYDRQGQFTHFLAEVSNIPWNERHEYCHYIAMNKLTPSNSKQFKVSPFNPVDQHYYWRISSPEDSLSVVLDVHDDRGQVFKASLNLQRHKLDKFSLLRQLLRKPVMTASVVAAIYWQALKLFIKGVPYIPYEKEMI